MGPGDAAARIKAADGSVFCDGGTTLLPNEQMFAVFIDQTVSGRDVAMHLTFHDGGLRSVAFEEVRLRFTSEGAPEHSTYSYRWNDELYDSFLQGLRSKYTGTWRIRDGREGVVRSDELLVAPDLGVRLVMIDGKYWDGRPRYLTMLTYYDAAHWDEWNAHEDAERARKRAEGL
jgi:hypothetical protein